MDISHCCTRRQRRGFERNRQYQQKQTLADILTVTPRTLQRRLSDEGTTFRALLNQLRMDMTEQYLQEGKLSHEEITFLLGFRDRGVFYRAFRQWFGTSPGEYQQAL
ncbi:MAG: hypothetical protein CSH36_01975 [Thalassolituus sp.]|nr:MAG: hypothetical protein CSH36_01975 [Thalassolituus sp.]